MRIADLTGPYTKEELLAAFNRVKNKEHWKGPIDVEIEEKSWSEVEKILFAIEFYTATTARWFDCGSTRYRIVADGYWAGPAC